MARRIAFLSKGKVKKRITFKTGYGHSVSFMVKTKIKPRKPQPDDLSPDDFKYLNYLQKCSYYSWLSNCRCTEKSIKELMRECMSEGKERGYKKAMAVRSPHRPKGRRFRAHTSNKNDAAPPGREE